MMMAAAMPMQPDNSTCNTTHSATIAATTLIQCDNSICNTMCGPTAATTTPNTAE